MIKKIREINPFSHHVWCDAKDDDDNIGGTMTTGDKVGDWNQPTKGTLFFLIIIKTSRFHLRFIDSQVIMELEKGILWNHNNDPPGLRRIITLQLVGCPYQYFGTKRVRFFSPSVQWPLINNRIRNELFISYYAHPLSRVVLSVFIWIKNKNSASQNQSILNKVQ